MLAVLVASALDAGCGSASAGSAPSTAAQSGASSPTTTATAPDRDVSGKLRTLPDAAPGTGQLPAVPGEISEQAERAYLRDVFEDAQSFWHEEFGAAGIGYHPARLRLFSRTVHSGCGAQTDTGPFYCGANLTIYLDLSFFQALARRAGVGPFAQAYIVGHEFGHHVQRLIGITQRVAVLNHHDPGGQNARSVRVELQADCLAGVWAHSRQARGELTDAELNDALRAAAFVGDDLQQRAAGRVVDSALWTHGSSEQRQRWLTTGVRSGSPSACDTFAVSNP